MLMLLWSVHQSRLPNIIVRFPRPDVKMLYKQPFPPTNTSYSAKPTLFHIVFCISLRTSKYTDIAGLCHGPGNLLLASQQRELCSMPRQYIWDMWQEKWYSGRIFKQVWGYNTMGLSVIPLSHWMLCTMLVMNLTQDMWNISENEQAVTHLKFHEVMLTVAFT